MSDLLIVIGLRKWEVVRLGSGKRIENGEQDRVPGSGIGRVGRVKHREDRKATIFSRDLTNNVRLKITSYNLLNNLRKPTKQPGDETLNFINFKLHSGIFGLF